ncbi:histone deacetylase superfamily protein [Rhizoclosmatium globosum]|uniref:Histone deacetylase superfamily protein n=1 Tax=Rhizoclosmatium globosum TaxID=329046 RepID=A0A1Y2BKD6_9FUNG|nr:histone deacetylase superfamily protein [Rhizoclosmatium globosum]|eukprot:ORY35233.1 histone deacetylase superfamily protein [Rhizoclosmatium globosum]
MKVVYSPVHARHNPPVSFSLGRFVPFKESPQRVDQILASLASFGSEFELADPVDHGMEPIKRVHTKDYIAYFQNAYEKWVKRGGNPDGVFPEYLAVRQFANGGKKSGGDLGEPGFYCFDLEGVIAEGTFVAAVAAVNVVLTAADLMVDLHQTSAFALCRPPGHHAQEDLCGGYCFFNNASIATRYLIEQKKVGKVCILDIDYHHGNGTQSIFYKESNPLYVSLHGSPDYPMYWGDVDEDGEGEGKGFNVNVPLPLGTRDPEYIHALKTVVETRISEYDPDVIVVSLGVDTFIEDTVGNFLLTSDCYTEIGNVIASLGKQTLFVMEGGYDIPAIGTNVTNVLRGFDHRFGK